MEKGIEDEENNLYNQTDEVAENVTDSLNGINANIKPNYSNDSKQSGIDYNTLVNAMSQAFSKSLANCKLALDDEGFAKIIKDELYKVV